MDISLGGGSPFNLSTTTPSPMLVHGTTEGPPLWCPNPLLIPPLPKSSDLET